MFKFITAFFAIITQFMMGPRELLAEIPNVTLETIDGKKINFSDYRGKVLLIANTASKCGFTPQYEDLENLYKKYYEKGFLVLGFPSNDFGGQDPGTNEEIKSFCETTFHVSFPLFAKAPVSGKDKQELFKHLTEGDKNQSGEIKWNFEKFLIDKKGNLRYRFVSIDKPMGKGITEKVEQLLAE